MSESASDDIASAILQSLEQSILYSTPTALSALVNDSMQASVKQITLNDSDAIPILVDAQPTADTIANQSMADLFNMKLSNNSDAATRGEIDWTDMFCALLLCVLIVITVIGNTLVILSVLTTRRLRTVTNCFVMSLAVADWLVGIFVMPPAVAVMLNGTYAIFHLCAHNQWRRCRR